MSRHIYKAFIAGLIAITVNTVILKAAPFFDLTVAKGGLLKLIIVGLNGYLSTMIISFLQTGLFWYVFHYVVGFVMVTGYVYVLRPLFSGRPLLDGTMFSLIPWLINGLIVLPLLKQGIMGYREISPAGMIYFFVANWAFAGLFVLLYEKFIKDDRKPHH